MNSAHDDEVESHPLAVAGSLGRGLVAVLDSPDAQPLAIRSLVEEFDEDIVKCFPIVQSPAPSDPSKFKAHDLDISKANRDIRRAKTSAFVSALGWLCWRGQMRTYVLRQMQDPGWDQRNPLHKVADFMQHLDRKSFGNSSELLSSSMLALSDALIVLGMNSVTGKDAPVNLELFLTEFDAARDARTKGDAELWAALVPDDELVDGALVKKVAIDSTEPVPDSVIGYDRTLAETVRSNYVENTTLTSCQLTLLSMRSGVNSYARVLKNWAESRGKVGVATTVGDATSSDFLNKVAECTRMNPSLWTSLMRPVGRHGEAFVAQAGPATLRHSRPLKEHPGVCAAAIEHEHPRGELDQFAVLIGQPSFRSNGGRITLANLQLQTLGYLARALLPPDVFEAELSALDLGQEIQTPTQLLKEFTPLLRLSNAQLPSAGQ
jgi:hypothetical protein